MRRLEFRADGLILKTTKSPFRSDDNEFALSSGCGNFGRSDNFGNSSSSSATFSELSLLMEVVGGIVIGFLFLTAEAAASN